VELIYTSHVLEHATRAGAIEALKRWFDVLIPTGILRLSVPDLEATFAAYFYHKDLRLLQNMLYGSQKHPYDFHYTGWDFKTMKEDLESVGFINVKLWDWKTTSPHNYTDDYSQAYLPHMDKLKGKLMSLNVEAYKPIKIEPIKFPDIVVSWPTIPSTINLCPNAQEKK
jgi:predicted SAM-dependent methyltransferase